MNRKAIVKSRIWRHTLPAVYVAIVCSLFLVVMTGCSGGGGGGGNRDSGGSDVTDTDMLQVEKEPATYSIKGTVTPAGDVISDSDVNDPNADNIPNDNFFQAQQVFVPCSISGYVNLAGEGNDGASFENGDPDDYYQVTLSDGLYLALYQTEDTNSADLNLYLYDEEENLLDASISDDGSESLRVSNGDGIYYIRVETAASASTYVLNVGYPGFLGSGSSLRLSDDFVAGEVLVRLKDAGSNKTTSMAESAESFASMGFSTKSGSGGLDRLLRRSEKVDKTTFLRKLGIAPGLARSLTAGKVGTHAQAKLETLWMARALRKQPGVQYAEPNYILKALTNEPDDTFYSYQWHYPLINLPDAWDITTGGDVVVAVADTGVLLEHPDLAGQLVDGYDFISNPAIALDGDGVDDNPDDPGDELVGGSFHGTLVAGTIGAASDNGTGVAGVSWQVEIMPLRVLGYGGGTLSDVLEAVKYAAGLETDAGVTLNEPVDIINLSLGSSAYSDIAASVYTKVREQGVIVVAAAGNSGNDSVLYPAGYEGVVSASAVTYEASRPSYSNYGPTIDVAAPGGDTTDLNGDNYIDGVLSTWGEVGIGGEIDMWYAFSVGTSMAAPHVSGVAALMKSLYPDLTPDEFDALLQGGYLTLDIGDSGRDDEFGYGLIDAYQAVLVAQEAQNTGSLPSIPFVNPDVLNFGSSLTRFDVTVDHIGGDAMSIDTWEWNASWLSVDPSSVDEDGFGTYTVVADRGGLSGGIYSDIITFRVDNGSQVDVSAVMWVEHASGMAAGGYYYVLLMDSETMEKEDGFGSSGENGIYEYGFSNLSHGDTYLIYAGTDSDWDGYICDEGEICGAYISIDDLMPLTIEGDTENIDFETHTIFSESVGSSSSYSRAKKLPTKMIY